MSHLDDLKKLQDRENGTELPIEVDVSLPKGIVITEDTELIEDAPPAPEVKAQEEADLVVTSKVDLEAIIKDVVKAYDVKIEAAADRIDKLALIIEMQEKKGNVTAPKRSSIRASKVRDRKSVV